MSRFFSNGTEGRAWEVLWCQRCEHDHTMHDPEDQSGGCIHLLHALFGEDELLDGVWTLDHDKHGFTFPPPVQCSEFVGCAACGHGDVTLDENGFVPPARQREYLMAPNGPVLITDQILHSGPREV